MGAVGAVASSGTEAVVDPFHAASNRARSGPSIVATPMALRQNDSEDDRDVTAADVPSFRCRNPASSPRRRSSSTNGDPSGGQAMPQARGKPIGGR